MKFPCCIRDAHNASNWSILIDCRYLQSKDKVYGDVKIVKNTGLLAFCTTDFSPIRNIERLCDLLGSRSRRLGMQAAGCCGALQLNIFESDIGYFDSICIK